MNYSLGNMLSRGGALNPDGLALDLQFAADKTLTARKGPTPTFTRASTATFVGSNGLIQTAAINAPRFDHDPVTLASRGLLIEESRTNLVLQSNDFSISPWGNLNSICIVSQNETGPNGTTNSAWTITDDSNLNTEGRFTTANLTSGVVYSFSIFLKKTTGTPLSYPAIWLARGSTFGGCSINTTAGTAAPITLMGAGTSALSTTVNVIDFGNFWRVTSFITPNATGSWEISIAPSFNGNGTGVIDGTTTGNAVFWGAQLEAGSFPTSYIPTTTASVVRSADVCSITGSDFSGFYNQSEGTLFAESSGNGVGRSAVMMNSGTNANQIAIIRGNASSSFDVASNGAYSAQISSTIVAQTIAKIAGSYGTNDARAAFNGILGTADITVVVPTNVNRLNIGSAGAANIEQLNGHIARIQYFRKRLPNAKLQSLTA